MAQKKRVKRGRRVTEDGRVWYYYYKRKNGRPKKPGPKKKPKPKEPKPRVYRTWDYKIVRVSLNKQNKYIGRFHDLAEVEAKRQELEELNKNVVFPRKTIINFNKSEKPIDEKCEYLILKRNYKKESPSLLRNSYGKLVEHTLNTDDWIIYDKFPCVEEETFWVYGYDNKTDRKTFDWIYENLIINIIQDPHEIVNVYIYNNKVIFKYDYKEFNFVMCKNVSDAIRLYNLIEQRSKKLKQVILTGITDGRKDKGKSTIEMIREKTGWKYKKIWERSTRH